jgi:hypothetical protein
VSSALPVLGYDFPLDGPVGWHEANRYLLWTGRVGTDAPVVAIQERVDDTAITLPARSRSLSLIPAGTPHRLTHLFGFWRISDADTIVLRAALPEAVYICIYVSSGPQHERDRILWYCESCGSAIAPFDVDIRRYGARAFWDVASLEHVRRFNAALDMRTCPNGCVHGIAYGFAATDDSVDERQARAIW